MTQATTKVFISYGSPHDAAARALKALICRAYGLSDDAVFLASESIPASASDHDDFTRAITRNALESSAFIVLGTRDYSPRFWCRYEVVLRGTLLLLSGSACPLRETPQWFPLWIDDRAEIGREFGKDEVLRLTGLSKAQGYRAWDAGDAGALLQVLAAVLKCDASVVTADEFVRDMGEFVKRQYSPDMAYARLLGGLRDAVVGIPIPDSWEHQHVVDGAMSLTLCTAIADRGLPTSAVKIQLTDDPFVVPPEHIEEYRAFFAARTADPGKYWDASGKGDGDKIMLAKLPYVGTDHLEAGGTVFLHARPVKFSQVLYFQDRFVRDATLVARNMKALAESHVATFPSILCLHAVLVTTDDRVTIVRRGAGVHYYSGKYAATIEEQFNPRKDAPDGASRPTTLGPWVSRALHEEMALDDATHYSLNDVRVLSIFLERTIMNISLSVLVPLQISADELRSHLANHPRPDYEFDRVQFFTDEEALRELRAPSLSHHPTSRYRLLMMLFGARGSDWIKRKLVDLEGR